MIDVKEEYYADSALKIITDSGKENAMKIGGIKQKIGYSYENRVLGDAPLTRRHVYTKCVCCDGHWESFSSVYRIIVSPFDLR